MKYLAILITLLTVGFLTTTAVSAQTTPECFNIYNSLGACATSDAVSVQKQIQNPGTNTFVDILPVNEARIKPGGDAVFRITITNRSNGVLKDINFTDALPGALEFVSTQKGDFNSTNNTITYSIKELGVGASETFDVYTRVKADQLPTQALVCLTNLASIKTGREEATDNVQFCIGDTPSQTNTGSNTSQATAQTTTQGGQTGTTTKGGKVVHGAYVPATSPDTGPEMLALIPLVPAAIGGYFLRRKSSSK